MPKRNNERQQIIEMLKRINARPGSTVTASKMMVDSRSGREREVDVAVEEDLDGHRLTQSFEVTSIARKVDIRQVEQLIKKHETLPTNRLFIVSWSGFSRSALEAIEGDKNTFAVEPVVETGPTGPVVKNLTMDTATLDAERVVCRVRLPDGSAIRVQMETDHDVFGEGGVEVGPMAEIVAQILNDPETIEFVLREVHDHPQRDTATHYTLGKLVGDQNLYLHQREFGEMHQVEAVEITGPIRLGRAPLDLEVRSFDNSRFAHGTGKISDKEVLFVAGLDDSQDITGLGVALYPPGQSG
jgi:hypothetical protein